MILSDATFIIPIRIDSQDRIRNLNLVSKFLTANFNSKLIIKECDITQKFDPSSIIGPNVTYIYEQNSDFMFHKTRLLNDMIVMSDTDIIVQYDTDIILPYSSYLKAAEMIRGEYDSVYPFIHGHYSSKKVHLNKGSEKEFSSTLDIKVLDRQAEPFGANNNYGFAHFGFCTFYKKSSYINGFMENEEFYSGGPEDQEIHHRFVKLGMNVGRVENFVYHLEHQRGNFSLENNVFYYKNIELYDRLMAMNPLELREYYSSRPYYRKRIEEINK